MIDNASKLLEAYPHSEEMRQLVIGLYELLEDYPPSLDPPQAGPLFVFRADYARIVGL